MVLAMLPKGSSSQIVIDPIAPTDAAVDDRIDTLKDHDGGDVVDTPESTITTATTTDLSTTSTRNDDNDTLEDAELIRQAEAFFAEQRHVKAAKLLRSVSEPSKLTAQHHRILAMADAAEQIYRELSQPHPVGEGGWSQVGNRHGHRHTVVEPQKVQTAVLRAGLRHEDHVVETVHHVIGQQVQLIHDEAFERLLV